MLATIPEHMFQALQTDSMATWQECPEAVVLTVDICDFQRIASLANTSELLGFLTCLFFLDHEDAVHAFVQVFSFLTLWCRFIFILFFCLYYSYSTLIFPLYECRCGCNFIGKLREWAWCAAQIPIIFQSYYETQRLGKLIQVCRYRLLSNSRQPLWAIWSWASQNCRRHVLCEFVIIPFFFFPLSLRLFVSLSLCHFVSLSLCPAATWPSFQQWKGSGSRLFIPLMYLFLRLSVLWKREAHNSLRKPVD